MAVSTSRKSEQNSVNFFSLLYWLMKNIIFKPSGIISATSLISFYYAYKTGTLQ